MSSIHLKSRNGGIDIGQNQTVKVNCNIGANNLNQYKQEIARLNAIKNSGIMPDSFMDLSLCSFNKPLYRYIDEIFKASVGVVPAYQLKEYKEVKALDLLKKYADDGIAFMTLHQVMVENVGHIDLKKLEAHCSLLKDFNAPIMPLGPIPTDCAVGMDHIATAIGASFMGYKECAHIINCITASEHKSSFPSILETIEAIKVAKLTAHIIDITKGYTKEDEEIYLSRASASSCLVSKNKSCNRCDNVCPLKMKI